MGGLCQLHDQIDVGAGGTGTDCLWKAGDLESFEEQSRSGEQADAPAGESAIKLLLSLPKSLHLSIGQLLSEHQPNDVEIASPKSRLECFARERLIHFAG